MVVCDMVTHTAARRMGLDAFLITSGVESLHSAIDQAISISLWFGRLRQENMFLRSITQDENGRVVVMEGGGSVFYSSHAEPSQELSRILRQKLKEVPPGRFPEILPHRAESALPDHRPDAPYGRGTVRPVLLRSIPDPFAFQLGKGRALHEPGRM